MIFKPSESFTEFEKLKGAMQTRRIANENRTNDINDKGLITVKLNFKKPMKIEFINNVGSRMLKYSSAEISDKDISMIMPRIIAENHNKFI